MNWQARFEAEADDTVENGGVGDGGGTLDFDAIFAAYDAEHPDPGASAPELTERPRDDSGKFVAVEPDPVAVEPEPAAVDTGDDAPAPVSGDAADGGTVVVPEWLEAVREEAAHYGLTDEDVSGFSTEADARRALQTIVRASRAEYDRQRTRQEEAVALQAVQQRVSEAAAARAAENAAILEQMRQDGESEHVIKGMATTFERAEVALQRAETIQAQAEYAAQRDQYAKQLTFLEMLDDLEDDKLFGNKKTAPGTPEAKNCETVAAVFDRLLRQGKPFNQDTVKEAAQFAFGAQFNPKRSTAPKSSAMAPAKVAALQKQANAKMGSGDRTRPRDDSPPDRQSSHNPVLEAMHRHLLESPENRLTPRQRVTGRL